MLELKKGEKVILKGFTGIKLGVFEVTAVTKKTITINKKNHVPSQVKMRQGKTWSTINISGFKSKNIPNSTFTFNSKECPGAEVVDLR